MDKIRKQKIYKSHKLLILETDKKNKFAISNWKKNLEGEYIKIDKTIYKNSLNEAKMTFKKILTKIKKDNQGPNNYKFLLGLFAFALGAATIIGVIVTTNLKNNKIKEKNSQKKVNNQNVKEKKDKNKNKNDQTVQKSKNEKNVSDKNDRDTIPKKLNEIIDDTKLHKKEANQKIEKLNNKISKLIKNNIELENKIIKNAKDIQKIFYEKKEREESRAIRIKRIKIKLKLEKSKDKIFISNNDISISLIRRTKNNRYYFYHKTKQNDKNERTISGDYGKFKNVYKEYRITKLQSEYNYWNQKYKEGSTDQKIAKKYFISWYKLALAINNKKDIKILRGNSASSLNRVGVKWWDVHKI